MKFDQIKKGTKIEYQSPFGPDKGVCIYKDDETADFMTDSSASLTLKRSGFKKTIDSFQVKELDKSVKVQSEGFGSMMDMVFGMMSKEDQEEAYAGNWVNTKETKEEKLKRLQNYLETETDNTPELKKFQIKYELINGCLNVNGIQNYRRTFFSIDVTDENSFKIGLFSPGRGNEDIEFRDKDMIVAFEFVKRHLLADWNKFPFFIMYMLDKKLHHLLLESNITPHHINR